MSQKVIILVFGEFFFYSGYFICSGRINSVSGKMVKWLNGKVVKW
jgi:hypothetical protein